MFLNAFEWFVGEVELSYGSERQKLTLEARITEPLIGPSEISQGDGDHRGTPCKLTNNVVG